MKIATYVSDNLDGHHRDYDRLFEVALKEIGITLQWVSDPSQAMQRDSPLFYSMFDRTPRQTLGAAWHTILRSLRGQRTVGLFFRPESCFLSGPKYLIRRLLFRLVSGLPNTHLLSLLPFPVAPRLSFVATNWIYDPQLWDLPYLGVPEKAPSEKIDRLLFEKAQGRRIIVSLGGQNRIKGFDAFASLWSASPEIRKTHLFLAAGKVAEMSRASADRFLADGGLLLDEHIEDTTLFHLYGKAHAVWTCYAPDYDQSSGIFGRAVQLGVPTVVRQGSFLDSSSTYLAHPTLAVPFHDIETSTRLLLNWQPGKLDADKRNALVQQMRDYSVAVLADAFGAYRRT